MLENDVEGKSLAQRNMNLHQTLLKISETFKNIFLYKITLIDYKIFLVNYHKVFNFIVMYNQN